jgi:hypothetical protein
MLRSNGFALNSSSKLSKMASEMHRMLKEAFSHNVLEQTQTYEQFTAFPQQMTSVDDEKHSL